MKKISEFLNFIIFALVAVIAGAFFYLREPEVAVVPEQAMQESPAKVEDQIVNKYLQQAAKELQKQKMITDRNLIDTKNKLAELERRKKLEEQKSNENIPLERQVWKETPGKDATVTEILNAQINETESQMKMDEVQKKEYARQFIENARAGGYHIELSDDLEVIKVTPIRKPSQENDSAEGRPSD